MGPGVGRAVPLYAVAKALVLRPLIRERTRTILTTLGIAVGVSVVVAIQLANQSALRAFGESVEAVAGRANYQLTSDSGVLDENILLSLQPLWREGVRFAPVIDIEGMIGTAEDAAPIRLLAVDLLSDLHFREYRYATIDVAGPRTTGEPAGAVSAATAGGVTLDDYLALFQPGSIVLPAPLAASRGLRIGSRVVLAFGGSREVMTVRGILEAEGPAAAFNGAIAIADISVAQQSFGLEGRLTRVDLIVPEKRAEDLLAAIPRPPGLRVERPSQRNERVDRMLRAFRVNLFALSGVALLVGVFLVYNTVLISVLRRRKDVGILKTIGTTPRQILAVFLGEGLLLGSVGAVLGVVFGTFLARSILATVGRTIDTLYLATRPQSVDLTPGVVLTGLLIGTLLAVASAVHPAIEASRFPPFAMIQPGLHQRVGRTRRLGVLAVVCAAAALLVTQLPPVGGVAVAGYLAVLLVVAAFSLLAPAIVRGTSRVCSPLTERGFGIVGRLAAVALPASLRRTSIASAALALAIGMMVAVALMVGSFRETVRIWVDQTVTSDLWLRPSKGLRNAQAATFPPGIASELERLPFVAAIDRTRGRTVVYRDSLIMVASGDFDVAAARSTLPMVQPRRASDALRAASSRKGAVVSETFALRFDKRVGDLVDLPSAGGILRLPITGIYRDYSNDRGVVVMDRELYARSYRDDAIDTIVVYLHPGVERRSAVARLERLFGARYGAFVVTNEEVRREVLRIFDQTFAITWALLGIAIVVAVLGIVNTMAALILERRRELALLRLGGLSYREIATMLLLESTLLGVASAVSGVVMGWILSWILIHVINRQSFGWTIEFHVPFGLIAVSVAITLCAAAAAGLAPARMARRLDLAAAIKSE